MLHFLCVLTGGVGRPIPTSIQVHEINDATVLRIFGVGDAAVRTFHVVKAVVRQQHCHQSLSATDPVLQ